MVAVKILCETMRLIHAAGGAVRTVRDDDGARFVAVVPLDVLAVADLMVAGVLVADGQRDLRLAGPPLHKAGASVPPDFCACTLIRADDGAS